MATRPETWAVVGGGILGMSLAHRLASIGREVTVVEGGSDLGGLASTWEIGGVRWDRHYHVIMPTDGRTLALMAELGIRDEVEWRSVPAGCEYRGVVHPATTPAEILRLPFLGWLGKARLGITAVRAAVLRDPARLERITAVQWLRRWSGREATEVFWMPLLRSKLGSNVEAASATFIATTLRRLATARRRGGGVGDGFGFVRGGYADVLDRMAARLADLGVKVRLGQRVIEVRAADGGLSVATADGVRSSYDKVVVTAAAPLAARMCPDLDELERHLCAHVTYQGIVCVSVLLTKPITTSYITYLLSPQPFTAVIDMSALTGTGQLRGHGLVYLPSYVRSDDPLFDVADDEIVATFLAGLESVYPASRGTVVTARVSKVRHVLPVPTLGYTSGLPPVRTSVPGLYLASSALITDGTLNVDETLGVAERALPTLLEEP
jgi:protoporphyrinogen oxidase